MVKTRVARLHLTEAVHPMLAWISRVIKEAAPCLDTFGSLDL